MFAMKLQIILVLTQAIAYCHQCQSSDNKGFKRDILQHFKEYNIVEDAAKHVFWSNYENILRHNERFHEGKELYLQTINQFTHLTEEENAKYAGASKPSTDKPRKVPKIESWLTRFLNPIPDSFDWRNKITIQPPQHQGKCGSCYAFAGIGAIEAAMSIEFKVNVKLSEMEAMECINGCDGSSLEAVFEYTKKKGGAAYASDHPYNFRKMSNCATNRKRAPDSTANIWQHAWSSIRLNEDAMKYYLVTKGPIVVGFEVYDSFNFYDKGIYTHWKNEQSPVEKSYHAVLLIGYGTKNRVNFWIFKNSYGEKISFMKFT